MIQQDHFIEKKIVTLIFKANFKKINQTPLLVKSPENLWLILRYCTESNRSETGRHSIIEGSTFFFFFSINF